MSYSPFHIHGADRPGPWLITCDHASNTVPDSVNAATAGGMGIAAGGVDGVRTDGGSRSGGGRRAAGGKGDDEDDGDTGETDGETNGETNGGIGGGLGLGPADMARHIAYDVGAAGVALALGRHLDAPVIATDFSRLVIDPNRGEDDPTLLMRLYDGTVIPGNRHVGPVERERRLNLYHRPYHAALEALAARRDDTALVSVHSFTAQLAGHPPRPWEIGILYGGDTRLAAPLLTRLAAGGQWCVGANQPYGGHLPGDAMDRHGLSRGRPHVLIELRNDLIATAAAQADWAAALAPHLAAARADAHL